MAIVTFVLEGTGEAVAGPIQARHAMAIDDQLVIRGTPYKVESVVMHYADETRYRHNANATIEFVELAQGTTVVAVSEV